MQPAELRAKVDGVTVFTLGPSNYPALHNEATTLGQEHYVQVNIPLSDLSAGDHVLRIEYEETHDPTPHGNPGCPSSGGFCPTNWWVDMITLSGTATTPPPPPVLTGSNPPGPAPDLQPNILGSAQNGSTVRFYGDSECQTAELGSGRGGVLEVEGVDATVALQSVNTIYATAENEAGVSDCSSTFVDYTQAQVPVPPTLTTWAPVSGSNDNHPKLSGTAPGAQTVKIYKGGGACNTEAVATVTAAEFVAGVTVDVTNNSNTSFRARAYDGPFNSNCSSSIVYSEVTPKPAAPDLTATNPPSGANQNQLNVLGEALAGTTVSLYTNDLCAGDPVATGAAADLLDPGFPVTVADDSTTNFHATAQAPTGIEAAAGTSVCSEEPLTYAEVSTPPLVAPPLPIPAPPDTSAQRAAAMKKCKKKKSKKKKKKCKKAAKKAFR
jgi:hypothetical protein